MEAQQGQKQQSSLSRILIVAALATAVGAVIYMKQRPLPEQSIAPVKTSASLPRLVDLGSDRCQSCLAMMPVLEALTVEYKGRFDVLFLDIGKNPEEADRYNIQLIPTQIFFDGGGKEIFRHKGFYSRKEILAKWKDLGFKFDG